MNGGWDCKNCLQSYYVITIERTRKYRTSLYAFLNARKNVTDIKQEEAGSADIEEREDEEMAIQTLPKTGRSKDYTMFAWLFSGLILLAMVILKRKVK